MRIKLNVYRRKNDGRIMLYANNDRKVSVGIAEDGLPAPYGKNTTDGQRNLMDALSDFFKVLEAEGGVVTGTPDFDAHSEDKARLGRFGDLYVTDVATVGGVSTGADGAFLFKDGKLFKIDRWITVD